MAKELKKSKKTLCKEITKVNPDERPNIFNKIVNNLSAYKRDQLLTTMPVRRT